ncbi:MAG: hypothetical protein GXX79_10190 [Actinomycetales bacterium]|nr:hypothetical protein [Actinomycetales bacterium]
MILEKREPAVRRTLIASAAMTALVLTGCGSEPTESPAATPSRQKPAPLVWVRAGYGGNPWLPHVTEATWDGDQIVVATDYPADTASTAPAKEACTAFRAYELFAKRGTTVTVNAKSGDQLATC